ncbi:MAG: hypothetical protein WD030_03275 [Pirellulales bacterium]
MLLFDTAGGLSMVFEQIEHLKQQYTDKFVVVDESRPELLRFAGTVGRVKTVNMSGRALVEFGADANIGWYDIDPDFLKVVDRPKPQPPEAKKKTAPAKKPAAPAAKQTEAKPAGKLSTADILAAARGGPKPAEKPKPAGKPSTADILAAARGEKAATPAAPPEAAEEAAAAEPLQPQVASAGEKVDRTTMSVADILAWCRAHDGR